jgi:hypothetical protein
VIFEFTSKLDAHVIYTLVCLQTITVIFNGVRLYWISYPALNKNNLGRIFVDVNLSIILGNFTPMKIGSMIKYQLIIEKTGLEYKNLFKIILFEKCLDLSCILFLTMTALCWSYTKHKGLLIAFVMLSYLLLSYALVQYFSKSSGRVCNIQYFVKVITSTVIYWISTISMPTVLLAYYASFEVTKSLAAKMILVTFGGIATLLPFGVGGREITMSFLFPQLGLDSILEFSAISFAAFISLNLIVLTILYLFLIVLRNTKYVTTFARKLCAVVRLNSK